MRLVCTTLVVRDYDEAIAYFTGVIGLQLTEDEPLGGAKRWVVVCGSGGARLLLAKADGAAQTAHVGDQTGGRVGFFLETADFAGDHAALSARGVKFLEAPRRERYGQVAVFEDLYGNKWDLIEARQEA